jgi:hypothetical protein
MFLIPALMAMALARPWRWTALLILLGFVLVFLSHAPANRIYRRWSTHHKVDREALPYLVGLGGIGILLLAGLYLVNWQWTGILLGLGTLVLLFVHLKMTRNREHLSVPGELIGVLGLTSAAPLMYLHLHASLDARGWVLWLVNFLYFAGSIFYVKLKFRVQPRRPEPALRGKLQAGAPLIYYNLFLLLFVGILTAARNYSWYFVLAYVPFWIKSGLGICRWQSRAVLKPFRVGFAEVGHALLFGFLAYLGFINTIR